MLSLSKMVKRISSRPGYPSLARFFYHFFYAVFSTPPKEDANIYWLLSGTYVVTGSEKKSLGIEDIVEHDYAKIDNILQSECG